MIRALQISIVILAATVCANCTSLAILRQRSEYRGFLEDWGVGNQKRIWIYQP